MLARDIGEVIGLTQHEIGVLRYKLKLPPRLIISLNDRVMSDEARRLVRERCEIRLREREATRLAWIERGRAWREAKEASREARKREREARLALNPPRQHADKQKLRTLFDEGVGIPELASYFKISEQTVKQHLKATR